MHFLSAFLLLGSACSVIAELSAGQRSSLMAMRPIFERQIQYCTPIDPPYTCERSCGPGNIECISFPTCYNPSAGESCCSDGTYCPASHYCTDTGCCPNGSSLVDCGASLSLSVIPPPAASTIVAGASSTSSAAPTTSSPAPESTTSTSSSTPTPMTPDSSTTSSALKSPTPTKASPTITPKIPTSPSSSKSASSTPSTSTLIQASTAGRTFGFDVIHVALGWFGVLFLVL